MLLTIKWYNNVKISCDMQQKYNIYRKAHQWRSTLRWFHVSENIAFTYLHHNLRQRTIMYRYINHSPAKHKKKLYSVDQMLVSHTMVKGWSTRTGARGASIISSYRHKEKDICSCMFVCFENCLKFSSQWIHDISLTLDDFSLISLITW